MYATVKLGYSYINTWQSSKQLSLLLTHLKLATKLIELTVFDLKWAGGAQVVFNLKEKEPNDAVRQLIINLMTGRHVVKTSSYLVSWQIFSAAIGTGHTDFSAYFSYVMLSIWKKYDYLNTIVTIILKAVSRVLAEVLQY